MSRFAILACLLLAARAVAPNPPTITEPATDGQIVNPADVHMQAGYSTSDGSTHASTDWELHKASGGELVWNAAGVTDPLTKVHIHLADGAFVGSYAGRTTLEFDLDYQLVVRMRNNLGEVSPDSVRLFHTNPAGPPGVAGPLPWVPFQAGYRIEKVASGFKLPVNIAFVPTPGPAPTDPLFYVTELYGTIKVVFRNGTVGTYAANLLNYDPTTLGSFPGAGEQGLTGIAVAANGDVYAACLQQITATERNPKVIRLTSADGGKTGSVAATLLMSGEPQGQSHQVSNVSIGPDGLLYVHNGDGFDYTTAGNLDSFRGKILRMNLDLTPNSGNPHFSDPGASTARKYVWAYGVRNPFGGAWRESDGSHYEVENGPSVDRLARIISNRNMGWNNTDASMSTNAIYNWTPFAHAPVNIAFVQPGTHGGSGFPIAKMDKAYVTESGPTHAQGPQALGKRVVEFQLATGDAAPTSGPTTLAEYNGTGFGTAVGLAAGPDGLYFTDLYAESSSLDPSLAGGQILRIRYMGIPPNGTGTGFQAEYFPTTTLSGASVSRVDPAIDFSWPAATPPDPGIPGDNFSVRWRGRVQARTTDTYTFYVQSIDGVRLWVNGVLLVDNWTNHASTENTGTIALTAGQLVDVVIEYYNAVGDALVKLSWSSPSQVKEAIPQSQLYAPAPPAAASMKGGGGGCGLLGLDAALLALLLRRRRLERRHQPEDRDRARQGGGR